MGDLLTGGVARGAGRRSPHRHGRPLTSQLAGPDHRQHQRSAPVVSVRGSAWELGIVLGLLLVVAVAVGAMVEPPRADLLRGWLEQTGPAAWALIVLGLALTLLTPVPRSVLSALVGAVAGFPAGMVVVVLAGTLGGLAGYGVSRSLGRRPLSRLLGERVRRLEAWSDRRGFLAVLAARVSPIPFMLVSYAAGLSGVRLGSYMLGTAVGVLPGSVLYVGVGASMSLFDRWATPWPGVVTFTALLVLALLGVGRWRRRRTPFEG